jgi:hypothetical protein
MPYNITTANNFECWCGEYPGRRLIQDGYGQIPTPLRPINQDKGFCDAGSVGWMTAKNPWKLKLTSGKRDASILPCHVIIDI